MDTLESEDAGNTNLKEENSSLRENVEIVDASLVLDEGRAALPSNVKLDATPQVKETSVVEEISATALPISNTSVSPWRSAEVDEAVTSDPVAGEISDTSTERIPDITGSPKVDEFPHEEVSSDRDTRAARTVGVVQQRNGSLGKLSLWGRALQTRLANFLPSRAGVLAIGVGVTAFVVFIATSSYFK